jgi:hypothetical protein
MPGLAETILRKCDGGIVEKIIYALWCKDVESREILNTRLKEEAAPALLALRNVRSLRFNLQDADVARAEALRQHGTDPQMDAAVQLWVDVAHDEFRASIDAILAAASGRIAAWVVLESTIIPNIKHPSQPSERTYGWSQFCFIKRPEKFTPDRWRYNWQVLHTPVAIDTQSNFEYIQNLIVRPLIDGPHPYAAIVEECFPTDAMDDSHVFFDAVGDDAKHMQNAQAMADSCTGFVEMPGGIDVLPTSQYDFRKLA